MIRAKILKTAEELAGLRPAWSALLEGHPAAHRPFSSWEWFEASVKAYSSTASRYVVVLQEHERIVGILPLVRRKTRQYGMTIKELAFCPNFNTPRNNLLAAAPQLETAAARAALDAVLADRRSWHILRLENIPHEAALCNLLVETAGSPTGLVIRSAGWQSACVHVADYASFDEYAAANVKKHYRKQLRRDLKRLNEAGQAWRVEYCETPEDAARGLEDLLQVRRASWKGKPAEDFVRFFREISPCLAQRGEMLIALLRVGGRPVAAQYLVGKDGEYYMILNDHDQQFHDAMTPGTNLLTLVLQEAFQRNWKVLCFSGIDYPYKQRLATTARPHESFQVFNSGLKSQATYFGKTRVLPLVRKARFGWHAFTRPPET